MKKTKTPTDKQKLEAVLMTVEAYWPEIYKKLEKELPFKI